MTSSRSTPTTPASGAHAHDAHGENLSEATLIHTPANQLHLGCHVLALFSVLCTTLSGTWKSRKVIQVESVNASGDGTGRHVNTALPHIGYRIYGVPPVSITATQLLSCNSSDAQTPSLPASATTPKAEGRKTHDTRKRES